MTEKFVLREHYIPDGILHDQDLYEVKLENNELTLSFKIRYFEGYEASYDGKYKGFKKCHIKCRLEEDDDYLNESYVEFTSYMKSNKKNITKTKILSMSISEFVEIANKELEYKKTKEKEYIKKRGYWCWEYLYSSVSPAGEAQFDLSAWIKYKGTVYKNCRLVLCTEEIEFIWE